ncbi:MAG: MBL fold metallo-hydrolase [Pseudomonadota bacterium]|jgi:glyoxylase-like metal-dependent hydrolase (beta-lactamase superfamily II)
MRAAIRLAVASILGLVLACQPLRSAFALDTVTVADGIYAFVGEKQQRSPANLANNATFGLIVTNDGAVLIDPGGSWKGAEALHAAVRTVTDQPVKFVINTGGQDHRWLGNGYWKAQGARVVASAAAVADQKARASMQMSMLRELLQDKLDGTEPAFADIVFDKEHAIGIGGLTLEIRHIGPAHTPGDSMVWIPARKTVFTGDVVYTERILGILDVSNSKTWLTAFASIATLQPDHVVPGHGRPTTLARAKADTFDYLVNLRARIKEHQDKGGNAIGSVKVDQSAFRYLEQFEALAGRNAQQVFAEMEFE